MIVVDCSVAAAWYLQDEMEPYAVGVLEALNREAKLFVPSLWLLELTNTLLVAERRGRLTRSARIAALNQVRSLPLKIAPSPTVFSLTNLQELAGRHGLSAYDAEYLRVAKESAFPLATLDRSLRRAAAGEKVPLFAAG